MASYLKFVDQLLIGAGRGDLEVGARIGIGEGERKSSEAAEPIELGGPGAIAARTSANGLFGSETRNEAVVPIWIQVQGLESAAPLATESPELSSMKRGAPRVGGSACVRPAR